MPRGYRRAILAIVGAIALGGLGVITSQLYHASDQRHADYYYQPASHPYFLKTMHGKAIAEPYKPHCTNPQTKENAELCGQWAAVEQSSETNRLTSFSLRVSIASFVGTVIATLLLVWTLIESRDTNRRQLRAYITINKVDINHWDIDGGHEFMVVFQNTGQTPAYNVSMVADALVNKVVGPDIDFFKSDEFVVSKGTIGSGVKSSIKTWVTKGLSKADKKTITYEHGFVTVFGLISYVDVFGREQHTRFRFVWMPTSDQGFSEAGSGNEAT